MNSVERFEVLVNHLLQENAAILLVLIYPVSGSDW
jgi:hypothetical protein